MSYYIRLANSLNTTGFKLIDLEQFVLKPTKYFVTINNSGAVTTRFAASNTFLLKAYGLNSFQTDSLGAEISEDDYNKLNVGDKFNVYTLNTDYSDKRLKYNGSIIILQKNLHFTDSAHVYVHFYIYCGLLHGSISSPVMMSSSIGNTGLTYIDKDFYYYLESI